MGKIYIKFSVWWNTTPIEPIFVVKENVIWEKDEYETDQYSSSIKLI